MTLQRLLEVLKGLPYFKTPVELRSPIGHESEIRAYYDRAELNIRDRGIGPVGRSHQASVLSRRVCTKNAFAMDDPLDVPRDMNVRART